MSELLKELDHEVLVANARSKLRMIFQSDSKNDWLDAEQLARVARMDPRLLYPIEHRNRSARADLAVMRSRDALVATRTRLVNHIHGVLKSFGTLVKKYTAPGFRLPAAGCGTDPRGTAARAAASAGLGGCAGGAYSGP